MKKYYLLLIGIALLIVNIEINTIKYPTFIPFETEAPITVSMVIDHNVGTHMVVDFASDFVGFLLVMLAARFFIEDSKDCDESNIRARRRRDRSNYFFYRIIPWSILGIVFYIAKKLMPFYLNGNLRFRSEYVLYFPYLIISLVVMVNAILGVTALLESVENHTYNNITIIFGLLSTICFLVAGFIYFFDLMIGYFIYYAVAIAAMGYMLYRIYNNLSENK